MGRQNSRSALANYFWTNSAEYCSVEFPSVEKKDMWPVIGGILSVALFIGFFLFVARIMGAAQGDSTGSGNSESAGWLSFWVSGHGDSGDSCGGGHSDGGGDFGGGGDGGGGE